MKNNTQAKISKTFLEKKKIRIKNLREKQARNWMILEAENLVGKSDWENSGSLGKISEAQNSHLEIPGAQKYSQKIPEPKIFTKNSWNQTLSTKKFLEPKLLTKTPVAKNS